MGAEAIANVVTDVKREICFASPLKPDLQALKDDDRLEARWRLFSLQRTALAAPFERIAAAIKPGATVNRQECDALDTVGAAIKLVARKAGVELV